MMKIRLKRLRGREHKMLTGKGKGSKWKEPGSCRADTFVRSSSVRNQYQTPRPRVSAPRENQDEVLAVEYAKRKIWASISLRRSAQMFSGIARNTLTTSGS